MARNEVQIISARVVPRQVFAYSLQSVLSNSLSLDLSSSFVSYQAPMGAYSSLARGI